MPPPFGRIPLATMIRNFTKWIRSTSGDRGDILLLVALLPLADTAIRMLGFFTAQSLVHRLTRGFAVCELPTQRDLAQAHRLAELARLVGDRHPWRATCLRQSLVLQALLKLRGLDSRIRVGVVSAVTRAPAHAWVEVGGVALDPRAKEFRTFDLPPPDRWRPRHGPALSGADRSGRWSGIIIVLLVSSALSGAASWSIRANLVRADWPEEASAPERAAESVDAAMGTESCSAPWNRPREDALTRLEADTAFGGWPEASRLVVDLSWIALLVLAGRRLRLGAIDRSVAAIAALLLVSVLVSLAAAWIRQHWVEILAGLRATLPWALAVLGMCAISDRLLRTAAWACTVLLVVQGPLALWELSSPNSPYGTALFGLHLHRLTGTFELPTALGGFAVVTWTAALCWVSPSRRVALLLSLLVALILLACGTASAWVSWMIVAGAMQMRRLRSQWRLALLTVSLPLALILWSVLPDLTGRHDVHDSLWGRIQPTIDFSVSHLDTTDRLFGFGFGTGTFGFEPALYVSENRVPAPAMRPPTDSTPAVLYWQFGLLGLASIYSLFFVALARDTRSRPVGVALFLCSLFISVSECAPIALLLAFWLARAAGPTSRQGRSASQEA